MRRPRSIAPFLRFISRYGKPHKVSIAKTLFFMIVTALTTGCSAFLVQPALDMIFVQKDHSALLILPLLAICNSIIKSCSIFLQTLTTKMVGQKIVSAVQLDLYEHMIYSDSNFFMKFQPGKIISRFLHDVNSIRNSVTEGLINGTGDFLTLVALMAMMFHQNLKLGLVVSCVFPPSIIVLGKLGPKIRKSINNLQNRLGVFTTQLDETLQNINVIKAYCREKYEVARLKHAIRDLDALYKKSSVANIIGIPIIEIASGIVIALTIWYGGLQVANGEVTTGQFFSFVSALLLMYKPLGKVVQLNTLLHEGIASAHRIFEILDMPTGPHEENLTTVPPFFKDYGIRFSNICFSYPPTNETSQELDTSILDGINITVKQGQMIAIVGGSGSGKTTLINLLLRLYDPTSGQIQIGGEDIASLPVARLRKIIALVGQDICLFDGNIMDNIRYGRLEATDEEVMEAAVQAGVHDFACLLPNGYQTVIGRNGAKLSGGQRQRITIARAMLKDAPILLLDEATSALDNESGRHVQLGLTKLMSGGKTTIAIAHRLSTVMAADYIYVIANGRVVEHGSHYELMQNNGEYCRLYQSEANTQAV